jgi:hypothetical protein
MAINLMITRFALVAGLVSGFIFFGSAIHATDLAVPRGMCERVEIIAGTTLPPSLEAGELVAGESEVTCVCKACSDAGCCGKPVSQSVCEGKCQMITWTVRIPFACDSRKQPGCC